MNFVAWFANLLITMFNLESDMAVGVSVILSIIILFALLLTISVAVAKIAEAFLQN